MIKAVVTGGAGFIGSYTIEELLKKEYYVVVLDSLPLKNVENIKHLLQEKTLKYVQGSINDLNLLEQLFADADYIFHLGAIPFTTDDSNNPINYYELNSNAILNVLQAAKDKNVKKVIFASSCAVYGNEPTLPKGEYMIPDPLSPYAITKLNAELYSLIFHRVYNLQTICLRYFNVYGPRQSPDPPLASVIPKFIQRVALGKLPVIFGDGNQTRDFVFVRDVVAANLLVAESNANGIFNVGTGQGISLNQVARTILELMNRVDMKPIYEAERTGEIRHSVADISKIKNLGYKPLYTLEQGLRETIQCFRKTQSDV